MEQVVFGVIDPRTREIQHVARVKVSNVDELRYYFRQFFIEQPTGGETSLYTAWLRELQGAGLEPEFVVLERSAGPNGKAQWIARLRAAGAELTNMRLS